MRTLSIALLTSSLMLACAAPVQQVASLDKTCEGLATAAMPSVSQGRITKAELIAAGKIKIDMPTVAGEYEVPQHCNIEGRLHERTGTDGKPYYIGFNMRLPVAWNGRFMFQGGGGTDGVVRPSLGMLPAGAQNEVAPALNRGYAVVSTDAGHQNEAGPVGSFVFGLEPQARIDLGYGHLPVVNAAAHDLMKTAYGKAPDYRYFVGCSNGGRQGMMAAQRYPNMFDGIIAGAPAYRVSHAAAEAALQTQLLASIAPKADNGKPILGSALSKDDLNVLSKGIQDACDALDGLKDGMVNNVQACNFSPAAVQCKAGETAGCLSAAKVSVVEKLFDGQRKSTGQRVYSNWPYDPGIKNMGWVVWRMGSNPTAMPPNAINASLIPGSMAMAFTTPPVTTLKTAMDLYDFTLGFNADRDVPKLSATDATYKEASDVYNSAESTDLTTFSAKGKIIFWHGMADPIFSANDTVRYMKMLQARQGEAKVADYSRLYLAPGMAHCRGGEALDKFEVIQPLVDWVEKGKAPDAIIASSSKTSPWQGRSRPMCVWPKQAFYKGAGDTESADNFECR
jgi:pimeloyl-ACP methyl ester carboxylesterase